MYESYCMLSLTLRIFSRIYMLWINIITLGTNWYFLFILFVTIYIVSNIQYCCTPEQREMPNYTKSEMESVQHLHMRTWYARIICMLIQCWTCHRHSPLLHRVMLSYVFLSWIYIIKLIILWNCPVTVYIHVCVLIKSTLTHSPY